MTNSRRLHLFALAPLLLLFLAATAHAQQPFYTDDADVTEKGKFHFEFSNQFDLLQRESFPALKQNTSSFELAYGLFEHVEVSVEAPLVNIFNARDATQPRTATGIGDTNLAVKYNFIREREDSRRPALTVSFNLELPTGSVAKGIGSGVADYSFNGIMQKTLTARTTLRLNGGTIFSGNTVSGATGIRGARGLVLTGGGSLVRKFTERLDLGAEITGAVTRNFDLSKGQLQTQVGGNYALRDNFTLDFGLIAGRFAASPRAALQLGFSVDF